MNAPAENGKFRVSALKNMAKTTPHGHNGYIKTLKDSVHFYKTRDAKPWPPAEVPKTDDHDELGNLGLT